MYERVAVSCVVDRMSIEPPITPPTPVKIVIAVKASSLSVPKGCGCFGSATSRARDDERVRVPEAVTVWRPEAEMLAVTVGRAEAEMSAEAEAARDDEEVWVGEAVTLWRSEAEMLAEAVAGRVMEGMDAVGVTVALRVDVGGEREADVVGEAAVRVLEGL